MRLRSQDKVFINQYGGRDGTRTGDRLRVKQDWLPSSVACALGRTTTFIAPSLCGNDVPLFASSPFPAPDVPGTTSKPKSPGNTKMSHFLARRSLPLADRKSTRLNSSHLGISYAVFC